MRRLFGRVDSLFVIGAWSRTAGARLARRAFGQFHRFVIAIIGGNADRRRQDRKVDAAFVIVGFFFAMVTARSPLIATFAVAVVAPAIVPLGVAITTWRTAIAFFALLVFAFFAFAGVFAFGGFIAFHRFAIFILPIVAVRTALLLLTLAFFLSRFEIGEDAEIMVGELQVIFGVHAVVIMLRVAGQFLVFFKHLAGVAARAVVDPVLVIETVIAVAVLLPVIVVATAATPIVVIIVILPVHVHQG